MAMQIIPKQREKAPVLANILLCLSLILFLASVASYFILNNQLKETEKRIASLDEQLAAANVSPEAAQEREVLNIQKKINDFSSLLSKHRYSSQLFPFIESITHPKVAFSSFSADIEKGTVILPGITDSFQTLGQQLAIFENEKLINKVELSNIGFAKDGKISFSFNLGLDSAVFMLSE